MTSVGRREHVLEAGHVALLGHRLLGSVAIVTGALATLRHGNGTIPAEQHALLEAQVGQNLASITEIARTLVHGEHVEEESFCAQCYGRGVVCIDGDMRACTCTSWQRHVELRDAHIDRIAHQRSRPLRGWTRT